MSDAKKLELAPPGYHILGKIGEGATGVVYKAEKNGRLFAIKFLKKDINSSPEEHLKFRKEISVMSLIRHPSIVSLVGAGEVDKCPYIVTEFINGQPLTELIKQGAISASDCVRYLKDILDGLSEVHKRGYVHGDIKPGNIIIQHDGKAILLDLGFALEAGVEANRSAGYAGTVTYSSPEQLGILNRPTDQRSDLFSFGVVLHECLTGKNPFTGNSVNQILQMRASQHSLLSEEFHRSFPALALITEKLTKKDPDDRYNSAVGCARDLKNYFELNQKIASNIPFQLGQDDFSFADKMLAPLIGRQVETRQLLQQYADVKAGHGSIVLILGESGSGKSRLCREVLIEAEKDGIVIEGKCQQYESLPFGLFREILSSLARKSLETGDLQQTSDFLKKLDKNTKVHLMRLAPSLAPLFAMDPKGDLASNGDDEEEDVIIADFLSQFSAALKVPLVLFTDDIQWADRGSLSVIYKLRQKLKKSKILILAAARKGAEYSVVVKDFTDNIGGSQAVINLSNLDLESSRQLLTCFLSGAQPSSQLADKFFSLTGGNPFLLKEYFMSVIENAAIFLNEGVWELDEGQLIKSRLPSDLVQLVLNRIEGLDPEIKTVLPSMAVAGMSFTTEMVSSLTPVTEPSRISSILNKAIREGLIEAIGQHTYCFLHDGVREAFYKTLDGDQKRAIHQATAAFLDDDLHHEEGRLFATAKHYRLGVWSKNPQRLFATNLKSALVSLRLHGLEEASAALLVSVEAHQQFQVGSESLFTLWDAMARLKRRSPNPDDSLPYCDKALTYAKQPIDVARVHCFKMEIYLASSFANGQSRVNEFYVEFGLVTKALGFKIPSNPFLLILSGVKNLLTLLLAKSFKLKFGMMKKDQEALRILTDAVYLLGAGTWMANDQLFMVGVAMWSSYPAYCLSLCREKVQAYALYAHFFAIIQQKKIAYRLLDLALSLATELGDRKLLAKTNFDRCNVKIYLGELKDIEVEYVHWRSEWDDWVDVDTMAISLNMLCYLCPLIGGTKASESYFLQALESGKNSSSPISRLRENSVLSLIYASQGNFKEAARYESEAKKVSSSATLLPWLEMVSWYSVMFNYSLSEGFVSDEQLEQTIASFKHYAGDIKKANWWTKFVSISMVQARHSQFLRNQTEENRRKLMHDMSYTASGLEVHFVRNFHDLFLATLARTEGNYKKAHSYLLKAEKTATSSENIWIYFHFLLESARLAHHQGARFKAQSGAEAAYFLAQKCGWVRLAESVAKEFQLNVKAQKSTDIYIKPTEDGMFNRKYFDSLLKVSLASTSSLSLDEQTRAALDELNNAMTSERAFILLLDETSGDLKFSCGRNDNRMDINDHQIFSSTVVKQVRETRQALIVDNLGQGRDLTSESIISHDLRSIMATPLEVREKFLGVLYIDSRVARGLFSNEDLEMFKGIANYIAIAIEAAQMASLQAEARELKKDREVTAAVQSFFLPKDLAVQTPTIDFVSFYRPATQCGGDWWWYEHDSENDVMSIVVGDVTGHGAGPALITASISTAVRVLKKNNRTVAGAQMLEWVHENLTATTSGEYLMSAVAVQIRNQEKKLVFQFAGAPPVYHKPKDGKVERIQEQGPILGSASNGEFQLGELEIDVQPGDRLMICTDGIIEMHINGAPSVNDRHVINLINSTAQLPLPEASKQICEKLDQMLDGTSQDDDFTWLLIDIK